MFQSMFSKAQTRPLFRRASVQWHRHASLLPYKALLALRWVSLYLWITLYSYVGSPCHRDSKEQQESA